MSVTSKLINARLLTQSPTLTKYIPLTQSLTEKNLKNMLEQFSSIYLKPSNSCQGKGILRVDQEFGSFILRSRDNGSSIRISSFSDLRKKIYETKRNRSYIIQQGIESVTSDGYPFDIRVHLTRIKKLVRVRKVPRTKRQWITAGIVARVAKEKDKIVTNAYSGGVSYHIEDLLTNLLHYESSQKEDTIHALKEVSMQATQLISTKYPKWSEYGLDIGIDANGQLWIYEINIHPGALVFKNLDKDIYRRILYLRKHAS